MFGFTQGPTISKNNGCRLQFGGPVLRDAEICVRLAFSNLHVKHAVFHNHTSCSLMLSKGEGSHPSGVCVKHLVFHTKLEDASVFFTSIGL